jgi:recombinational DNA repair protein RecT
MAKAKAVKRLAKYMPMSDEFVSAVDSDEKVVTENALSKDRSAILIESCRL